eukprot:m.62411 g.62411  ORF g.62411 m.62411 type:complete len:51 (+) comp13798_c0_seq1:137-289(+)
MTDQLKDLLRNLTTHKHAHHPLLEAGSERGFGSAMALRASHVKEMVMASR